MSAQPVPTIRVNEPGLQKAFDAITNFLRGVAQTPVTSSVGDVVAGYGMDVVYSEDGRAILEAQPFDPDMIRIFQLIRVADRLFLVPGHVHYKESAEQREYVYVEPCINGTSLYAEEPPSFSLPLEFEVKYKIYLVVGTSGGCDARFLLLGPSDRIDDYLSDCSQVFVTHVFTTNEAGYPLLDRAHQKLSSEPTICCPISCSSSSSSSASSHSKSEERSRSKGSSRSASSSGSESTSEGDSSEDSAGGIDVVTGIQCSVVEDGGRCCLQLEVEFTELLEVKTGRVTEETRNCCDDSSPEGG